MQHLRLKVEGMTCMGCVNSVKRILSTLPGIEQVNIDLGEGRVELGYDPQRTQPEAIRAAIEGGGYRVVSAQP